MKKIQNQGAKLVPLKHVVSRASKEKDFLNSMLKAPKTTLKNNALRLSDADGKKLNTMIAKARASRRSTVRTKPPGPWDW